MKPWEKVARYSEVMPYLAALSEVTRQELAHLILPRKIASTKGQAGGMASESARLAISRDHAPLRVKGDLAVLRRAEPDRALVRSSASKRSETPAPRAPDTVALQGRKEGRSTSRGLADLGRPNDQIPSANRLRPKLASMSGNAGIAANLPESRPLSVRLSAHGKEGKPSRRGLASDGPRVDLGLAKRGNKE